MTVNIDFQPYLGVPFRRGARGPDALDCHGLLTQLHADLSIKIIDFSTPASNADAATLLLAHKSDWNMKWEKQGVHDLPPHGIYAPGDTLLFRINGIPCHVGMAIDDFYFVHTWQGTGGVIRERLTLWEHRLHGIYRHHQLPG